MCSDQLPDERLRWWTVDWKVEGALGRRVPIELFVASPTLSSCALTRSTEPPTLLIGRPPLSAEVRELVLRLRRENSQTWISGVPHPNERSRARVTA
jgi:hypothetical protein